MTGANQAEGEQGDEDEAEGEQGDAYEVEGEQGDKDEAEREQGVKMRPRRTRWVGIRPRVLLQCAGDLGGAISSPPSSTQAGGGQDHDQTCW